MKKKLTYEEFVKTAIVRLRTGKYLGIHSVYSGFNEAFRSYYDGLNPIEATNKLAEAGSIVMRPIRGGMVLYLPEDAPRQSRGELALQKMGLQEEKPAA